jgi:hypothetical protein
VLHLEQSDHAARVVSTRGQIVGVERTSAYTWRTVLDFGASALSLGRELADREAAALLANECAATVGLTWGGS